MMKKHKYLILIIVLLIISLMIFSFNVRLEMNVYKIKTEKIFQNIRIGLVTDLHSCDYGHKQIDLTKIIDESRPNILLLGGDIIDDQLPQKNVKIFLEWASKNYETYYVTGNHEYWTNKIEEIRELVSSYGVTVLQGETHHLDINNQKIDLTGINDKEEKESNWIEELKIGADGRREGVYSILLTHRPEEIDKYLSYDFDLILAGHAHGSQWRIPGILNGLYAPNQGVFPKYAGGLYNFGKTNMIVSRGLSKESTRVPRIFNRPEYVTIDLIPSI